MADDAVTVEVEGRRLGLRNLDKVLYPSTGTTKGEVLAYYTAVAPALLRQLHDRPLTRKRWPDGVTGPSFFEKNLPMGTPDWVRRVRLPVPGTTRARETIDYPLAQDLATLVWLANLAALELHTPQWRVDADGAVRAPDRVVIDLDPGAPAGLAECARVAVVVRDAVAAQGFSCTPVTSGGKGMQLYLPLAGMKPPTRVGPNSDRDGAGEGDQSGAGDDWDGDWDGGRAAGFARTLAEQLERQLPDLVVSRMTKVLRPGKVLLDWSQNNPAKTTITPYSLRGRDAPTVAAPRTWPEIEAAATGRTPLHQLTHTDVTHRLATDGDLMP